MRNLIFLSFSDRERALRLSTEISELTFFAKKYVQGCFPGCLFLENRRENLKLNDVIVVALVLESKALYYQRSQTRKMRVVFGSRL